MSYENLVKQFLENGGQVTKVPQGATSQTIYGWCDKTNKLVAIENGIGGWRDRYNAEAKHRMKKRAMARPEVIAARLRREQVKHMASTHSVPQLSRHFGVDQTTIRKDLEILGIKAKPGRVFKKNLDAIAQMTNIL